MKRDLIKKLIKWKEDKNRKPLLLQGARQVGKTYLVNEFGRKEYENYIYLNFEQDSTLKTFFDGKLIPSEIISNLSFYLGKKINSENTLIFFDEIQEAPKAITSLKYFYEQAPEYHIISAGSLLGVSVGRGISFPVGKVNFLNLYPMSFYEYLTAFDEELMASKLLNSKFEEKLPEPIHDKLIQHLKIYLFLGGMPEVLQVFSSENDIEKVRTIQNEILEAYKRDFSKYTDKSQAIKTLELWNSIPYQLAKENKKFKYSEVQRNARASAYSETIEWLKSAGLINLVYNISVPKLPLSGYSDNSKFKIYLLDTGLLGAMLNLSSQIIIEPDALFKEYNGAFIENFVASQFKATLNQELYYWTSNGDAEVDFIVQSNDKVLPVEVKSGTSRNLKSLQSYSEKYKPDAIFRISPRNFVQTDNFTNIPLYANFLNYLVQSPESRVLSLES